MFARAFLLACASLLWLSTLFAQTTLNPDLSLVGDIKSFTHNDSSRPNEKGEFNLENPAMEFVVAGYLNPYARADAVIAWETENNASIEELYATILRGLPLGLNLRAGKYRLEFGRVNPVHPHAYSFIHQPLPHEMYFGEEGLNDMAIRASVALPTGKLYTEIMGAVLKGEALASEEKEEIEEPTTLRNSLAALQGEETRIKPGYFGRITTSGAVTELAELAVGASIVTSEYDRDEQLRATVFGLDFKYKWKPDRNSSITVEGEYLNDYRENITGGSSKSSGAYAYVDYRFRQKYNLGSMYEFSEDPVDNQIHVSRITGFVGFAPIEETTLIRIAGDWTTPKEGDSFWTAMLQFVFSLGPHQPHNF